MHTFRIDIWFFALLFSVAPLAAATATRDGTTLDRAILVEGDYKHSVDWEWQYLRKNFAGRMPSEQTLMQHNGRTYDSFIFAGGKAVYFDLTRFAGEIYKKRTRSLGQLMDEMGIK